MRAPAKFSSIFVKSAFVYLIDILSYTKTLPVTLTTDKSTIRQVYEEIARLVNITDIDTIVQGLVPLSHDYKL